MFENQFSVANMAWPRGPGRNKYINTYRHEHTKYQNINRNTQVLMEQACKEGRSKVIM